MATNFPTSVDVLTNPTANDSLNLPSHATQHANANDAIEAIENAIIDPAYPDQLVNKTTATVRPLPFAIAGGISAGITGSGTITFPVGRFTQAPAITGSVVSTNNSGTSVTFGGSSTSSVTAYIFSGTAVSTTARAINYVAIQMTSAATNG